MIEGTVLIIDDDQRTRDALQFAFIRRNWEVALSVTEEQALDILAGYDPTWVIVSWEQLGGTGHRFVNEIRKKYPRTRLLVLTESPSRVSPFVSLLKPDLQFSKPILADEVYQACDELVLRTTTDCETRTLRPA